jgi:hypothetical protein
MRIKEYPPLRLSAEVETSDGHSYRWGPDEMVVSKVTSNLSFGTVMPGGFDQGSVVLQRNPRSQWLDLQELSTVRFRGLGGGQIAYEGRIESLPDQSGDQMSITPGIVGWQSHLDDDSTARMIYVDQALTNWQSPTYQRQLNLQSVSPQGLINSPSTNISPPYDAAGNVAPSALQFSLQGPWGGTSWCEAWYDAQGIPLKSIYYWFEVDPATIGATDTNWVFLVGLSSDTVTTTYEDVGGGLSTAGAVSRQGYHFVPATPHPFAFIQQSYGAAAGGQGVTYSIYVLCVGVYGDHSCPLVGTPSEVNAYAVLSSDVEAHALATWCPKIKFTTGANGSIQASSYPIPQLSFIDPGTASAIIKGATAFELRDWAVWEGPTYYSNAYGARGKKWRVRTRDAQVQDAGPDITKLCNGVVVSYADAAGVQRTIGPPGTQCDATDSRLLDSDPQNPVNELGIKRYLSLPLSTTSTAAAAIQFGIVYLQQQATITTAGSATLTGYAIDDSSVIWPAWMVRAGDWISFIDASDTDYRRIVSTQYADSSKTNTIQLDQPPDTLDAILQRLQLQVSVATGA